jgi:peptidyl-prolyl cis-trans isomerase-like 4
MQSVLIDDRRIHVDFSQSVSKLHKDWISKRTGNKESMGGFDNLQKRTRYRDGEGNSRGEGYDLVFDTDKRDSKRHRNDDDKYRRSDSRKDDHRGGSKRDDGGSRRDDCRDYDRKRDDRREYDRRKDRRSDDRDRRRDDDRRRR